MDIAQRLDQAFTDPRSVLEQVMQIVSEQFEDITIRYYHTNGHHAASIMTGGQPGPGQRNFMPSVHVVVGEEQTMITWDDPNDEDFGNLAMVRTDPDVISNGITKILNSIAPQQDYAYELDDAEPTDLELDSIGESRRPNRLKSRNKKKPHNRIPRNKNIDSPSSPGRKSHAGKPYAKRGNPDGMEI